MANLPLETLVTLTLFMMTFTMFLFRKEAKLAYDRDRRNEAGFVTGRGRVAVGSWQRFYRNRGDMIHGMASAFDNF